MDKYKQRKQKGDIVVLGIRDDILKVQKKVYDTQTGVEIGVSTDRVAKQTLITEKATLEARLVDIDEILKEFDVKT